jgi:glutamine synthetase
LSPIAPAQDQTLTNPLCLMLDSPAEDFTRAGLLKTIVARDIERITFHYIGGDGELRELKLPVIGSRRAEHILALGERVDGSSVFDGLVDATNSDLYVVPLYKSAFLNPFDSHSLDFICRLMDRAGARPAFAPDCLVERAADSLTLQANVELQALAELEFFLLGESDDVSYSPSARGGYHASAPFFRYGDVVGEMVTHLARITGAVKYAHSEAGFIESLDSEHCLLAGRRGEQHEIELLARPAAEMADIVALARWIIRNVAYRRGLLATFAPKVETGVPGNGLHVHLELMRTGDSLMTDAEGELSSTALQLVGGLMKHAPSLCAFGNIACTSYMRMVPDLEAPTRIEWSDSDRSALVRVPLAWGRGAHLARVINPTEPRDYADTRSRQTVEWRLPDGSAHPHQLLAGLAVAAEWGLTHSESLTLADATRVRSGGPRYSGAAKGLEPLPSSCGSAAQSLLRQRQLYEAGGVFTPVVVEHVARQLQREGATFSGNGRGASGDERRHLDRRAMDSDVLGF